MGDAILRGFDDRFRSKGFSADPRYAANGAAVQTAKTAAAEEEGAAGVQLSDAAAQTGGGYPYFTYQNADWGGGLDETLAALGYTQADITSSTEDRKYGGEKYVIENADFFGTPAKLTIYVNGDRGLADPAETPGLTKLVFRLSEDASLDDMSALLAETYGPCVTAFTTGTGRQSTSAPALRTAPIPTAPTRPWATCWTTRKSPPRWRASRRKTKRMA